MKKLLILVLMAFAIGNLFAQEGKLQSSPKHWISGEVGLIAGGLRYEMMLSPKLSVGGTAFYNSFFFLWNSIGVNVTARYYPWAGKFYAELGAGYGTVTGTETVNVPDWYGSGTHPVEFIYTNSGAMITPGIGWKIDVGQPGGFFLNPSVAIPLVLGSKTVYSGESEFGFGMNFKVALGLGYAL
jgi:hypothetical protein